jgi:SAM-dependent methyltransferase
VRKRRAPHGFEHEERNNSMTQAHHEGHQSEQIQEVVRQEYAQRAKQMWQVAQTLYRPEELAGLPPAAITSALGVDHPVRAAKLHPGETVLDLGCGGGIDTLLSARAVGPTGQALGLDMTHEMIELAQANAAAMGLANTRFLEGVMEEIPLPDASVDVVISNGVFNLAANKDRVFAEGRRVLRPSGRLIVADMLLRGDLPAGLRDNPQLWSG